MFGATLGNKALVWRSGVGVDANGALIYAGGPALSVLSLGPTLQNAGAVRAMELDINTDWVSAYTYVQRAPPATPTHRYRHQARAATCRAAATATSSSASATSSPSSPTPRSVAAAPTTTTMPDHDHQRRAAERPPRQPMALYAVS